MSGESGKGGRRILDPMERTSEVLFGLIMVLSFTGSLSVASTGREEVRTVLIGAIGCNLAWGLVDAVMYVIANLTDRGRRRSLLRSIRDQVNISDACRIVSDAVPEELSPAISQGVLTEIAERVRKMPDSPGGRMITAGDLRGALGVFLLVFLSTFPVVLPFLFSNDLFIAMRWSNGIALVMMFLCGYQIGRYGGFSAVRTGLSMVALGVLLVGLTIALGG
jgi:hypothetical protein